MEQYLGKTEPRPYMIGKKETGHYRSAFDEALARFTRLDPMEMAAHSGTDYNQQERMFHVMSFGQEVAVSYPQGKVFFSKSGDLPIMGWRLVLLNYLGRADGTPPTGDLISYRELADGIVYYPAFHRESIIGLSKRLKGKTPGLFKEALLRLGGTLTGEADLAAVLPVLPHFPVTLKIWFPDDELPGSVNILFDSTANHYLHTEDIAVLGGYAAAFTMKEYRLLTGQPATPTVL